MSAQTQTLQKTTNDYAVSWLILWYAYLLVIVVPEAKLIIFTEYIINNRSFVKHKLSCIPMTLSYSSFPSIAIDLSIEP